MEFLIITGLSGAGKTRAADVLEDLDYYCVDNLPVALMTRFAELCLDTRGRYEKVALVTDIRDREGFGELPNTIEELRKMDCDVRILYMDADVPTLVRRYKESRRPHPLAEKGMSTEEAVHREEELLAPIKRSADYVVNSSSMTLGVLQNRLFSLFAGVKLFGVTRRRSASGYILRKISFHCPTILFGKEHVMHREFFHLDEKAAEEINQTKREGGRIIAVGTTSCRTIESAAVSPGQRGSPSD